VKKLAVLIAVLFTCSSQAQQPDDFDYFLGNRIMIRNGLQAVLMCNGLFTSGRTLEQVFAQELAYVTHPVGTVDGGEYVVDRARKAVAVGGPTSGPILRAAFREGIGCVVMSPNQDFDDIDSLPVLDLPYPEFDPATTPWPMGDAIDPMLLPRDIDWTALSAASEWAYNRESAEQVTLSLIVVHEGQIIHESYADGVDGMTRTRTWSTAKSIAATLIGMLVDDGRLELDAPLGFNWLPDVAGHDKDPRDAITLRHVLNMSSGLYPVEGLSSVDGARRRALFREPGTHFDYENYDTLLAVYAMKRALGDQKTYAESACATRWRVRIALATSFLAARYTQPPGT
jgi:hypothetical protein